MTRKTGIFFFAVLVVWASMLWLPRKAVEAHPATMVSTKIHLEEKQLQAEMLIEKTLLQQAEFLSPQTDQARSLDSINQAIDRIREGFHIKNNGKSMALQSVSHEYLDERHVCVKLTFVSKEALDRLELDYQLFFEVAKQHQNIVALNDRGETSQFILNDGHRHFEYRVGTVIPFGIMFAEFLHLGMEHIWFGFDHLAFLLALLIAGGSVREMVKVITSFTVAHSITLCLAVLGILAVPSQWVEALIALSIAYVAIENQWNKPLVRRWIITFYFGLIHGLGFAGSLADTQLPKNHFLASLFTFNLGVELGQLAIVVLVIPVLWLMGHYRWYPFLKRGVSWVVALMGLLWFVERAFGVELPFFPL